MLRERIVNELAFHKADVLSDFVARRTGEDTAEDVEQRADRILSLLTQTQGYPYEDDNGTTHWEGCWRERGHHNCAVEMVERLTQAQEPVGYVVMAQRYDKRGARGKPLLLEYGCVFATRAEADTAAAPHLDMPGFRVTVEPVGASPVASAPESTGLRHVLGIPPMGEQDLAISFAAAIGALRARGRPGHIKGAPSDEDHAQSLEHLRKRLLNALRGDDTHRASAPEEERGARKITRNEDTEQARAVWAAVDRGAEKAPQKVKDRIRSLRAPTEEKTDG